MIQQPPAIRLPPPSLPSYLTSSIPAGTSSGAGGSRGTQKKKPQAKDKGEAREKGAELSKRVLALEPGAFETREFFKTLPGKIASVLPNVTDQRRFVFDLCKAAWYKSQGEHALLFTLHVIMWNS